MHGARAPIAAVALAVLLPGCVLLPPPDAPSPTPSAPPEATSPFPTEGAPSPTPPGQPATTATTTPPPPGPDDPEAPPEAPTPTPTPPAPEEAPPGEPAPPAPPSPSPSPTPPRTAPGPAAPPEVSGRLVAGQDAGPQRLSRYVPSYALAPDGARLDASLRGVPDATVQIGSLFRVENADAVPRTLRLAATASPPAAVVAAELRVRDADGGTLALLDLRARNATADVTLPAGAVRDASWTLRLAEGAGEGSASFATTLTLSLVG